MIDNIQLTHDKINYFNDIINLYYTAIKKKNPEILQGKSSIVGNSNNQQSNSNDDVLNLYHLSNMLSGDQDFSLKVIQNNNL